MVYIKIDTGSRAKGFALSSSDYDYKIYTKSDRITFEKYIDNRQLLKNVHHKLVDGDVVHIDLYIGLMGIYTGKSPDLGIFARRDDVRDKYGVVDICLHDFIKKLTTVSIVRIMRNMMHYVVVRDAKVLLQTMFRYAFVAYYLTHKRLPENVQILAMIEGKDAAIDNYHRLMAKRAINNKDVCENTLNFFVNWQKELNARLSRVPDPPERMDIRHAIVMYALDEWGPVMPEDHHPIVQQIFPSITRLDASKKRTLAHQHVYVQEKLDGCNFRVIVMKDGKTITYGSRYTYRPDGNFMGFYRIREQLEQCTRALQTLMIPSTSFVVYGELVGWKDEAKTLPINVINYSAQPESLKFYAYEIQLSGGMFISFAMAQTLLSQSGFATIPYRECLYNDFVATLQFDKSTLFPDAPIEGYIIRFQHLMYKIKPEYKNLDKLKVVLNKFDYITKQFMRDTYGAVVKEEFLDALKFCYLNCNVSREEAKMLFDHMYNLYRKQLRVHNTDYKHLLTSFKENIAIL
ncbi:he65 [Hyphantria cunea granulovirus]|uniref:He65 n=1 Tax=Hyphantria cunea granulovirus TaxID=307448 RepID=A0AAE5YIZ7_9BBAC|nr:he65 [Hyphantria cunea granulovirus]QBQ01673.1 he65 [Hyphantria cunea granulovirus]